MGCLNFSQIRDHFRFEGGSKETVSKLPRDISILSGAGNLCGTG
jgi:hypothetical protein